MNINFGDPNKEFTLADFMTDFGDPVEMSRAVSKLLMNEIEKSEFSTEYVEALIAADRVMDYAEAEAEKLRKQAKELENQGAHLRFVTDECRKAHRRKVKK